MRDNPEQNLEPELPRMLDRLFIGAFVLVSLSVTLGFATIIH